MFGRTWRYYVGLLGLLLGLNACVTEDLRNPIAEGQICPINLFHSVS